MFGDALHVQVCFNSCNFTSTAGWTTSYTHETLASKKEILQNVLEEAFEFNSEVYLEKADDSIRPVFVFELEPGHLKDCVQVVVLNLL